VLAGVRIVFSRVIPLDQPPQQHELWKRAEQFGATCSERADASVTHVISKALGTQKVHAPHCAAAAEPCTLGFLLFSTGQSRQIWHQRLTCCVIAACERL